jgi:hypothetical protein
MTQDEMDSSADDADDLGPSAAGRRAVGGPASPGGPSAGRADAGRADSTGGEVRGFSEVPAVGGEHACAGDAGEAGEAVELPGEAVELPEELQNLPSMPSDLDVDALLESMQYEEEGS